MASTEFEKPRQAGGTFATAAPIAAVPIVLLGLWLATGIELGEAIGYVGYELGFVLIPGWLLYRAIVPTRTSPLAQFAFAWPLGLTLEIAFFIVTAALGVRDLLFVYPVVAGIAAAVVWRIRVGRARGDLAGATEPAPERPGTFTIPQRWAIAGVCISAFAYLALTMIVQSPLPGTAEQVRYFPDPLFAVALAAEAQNHWPMETPYVSGLPLRYHYFGHIHLASADEVTGIGLPVVYLRLILFPLVTAIIVGLAVAGRAISGVGWVGPLAAAMFLFAGEVDLIAPETAPFLGINPTLLWWSLSHTFGLVFLIPLVLLVVGLLDDPVRGRLQVTRGQAWALVAVVLAGAGGAKGVVIPLIAGGLVVYITARFIGTRELNREALRLVAACGVAYLVFAALLYRGASGRLHLRLGETFELIPALALLRTLTGEGTAEVAAFWGVGSVVAFLLLLGPSLIGLWWVVGRGRPALSAGDGFLLGTLVVGLLAFVVIGDPYAANAYLTFYGVAAVLPLSAAGIWRGVGAWAEGRSGSRGRVIGLAAAWAGVLLVLAYVGWQMVLDDHFARPYALLYPVVIAVVAGLIVWARRAEPAQRGERAALVVLALLVPAAINLPWDTVPDSVKRLDDGLPLYDSRYGITPGIYETARWARDNLDEDAVLSVSNQRSDQALDYGPVNIDFTAFSERRTFYEAWLFTAGALERGGREVQALKEYPYPFRRALETRLFEEGDRSAARTMQNRFDVTHIVVDRNDGQVDPAVYGLGDVVFSNDAMQIIELDTTDQAL